MPTPNEAPKQPPHERISDRLSVSPRPRGGVTIHCQGRRLELSPDECNRLKFFINEFSKDMQNGCGFYEDRRVRTPSTGKYVANRRGDAVRHTSETAQ